MPIIAKGREFELCPVGLHRAQVKEITQLTHDAWGKRVKFTFETNVIGEEGDKLIVFNEASLKLSPKSKLNGIIESILGRPITPDERRSGFDVLSLLGKICQVSVKHRVSQSGNTYAYVDAIITDNGNQQTMPPATVEADNEASEEEAADIPF
jgi:hypothetical protein